MLHLHIKNIFQAYREHYRAAGMALFCTVIFFLRMFYEGEIFFERDIPKVYIPLGKYFRDQILSGSFSDWLPFDAAGQPFIGNVIGGLFHPNKLLLLIFPAEYATATAILICFPVAFMGIFCLFRKLNLAPIPSFLGALLYTFNGYSVSMTDNLLYLTALSTVPWAFWATVCFFERSSFAKGFIAALCYALILFAGDTQCFVISCALGWMVVFLIDEEHCGSSRSKCFFHYCLVMLGTALMTMVQWLPALQLVHEGIPGAGTAGDATIWSFHPRRIPELFWGRFRGTDGWSAAIIAKAFYGATSGFWAKSVYFGIIGAILAVFGLVKGKKKTIFLLAGLEIFFVGLLFGEHLGLFELLRVLPFWKPFRYPEKLFPFVFLIASAMAALGLEALKNSEKERTVCQRQFRSTCFLLGVLVIGLALTEACSHIISDQIYLSLNTARLEYFIPKIQTSMITSLLLSGGALFIIAVLVNRAFWRLITIAVIFVLQIHASEPFVDTAYSDVLAQPPPPIQSILNDTAEGDRPLRYFNLSETIDGRSIGEMMERGEDVAAGVMDQMSILFGVKPLFPAIWGLEAVNGYLPGRSRRMIDLLYVKNDLKWSKVGPMLSAGYFSFFYEDLPSFGIQGNPNDYVLSFHQQLGVGLLKHPSPLPRAYLSRPIVVSSAQESLSAVLQTSFNPQTHTVVESPFRQTDFPKIQDDAELGKAHLFQRQPGNVIIDVDAHTDGSVLVLTDAYYSGWTATVDGSPAEILPANHAVRGVMMPKGKHRVEFRYRTPGLIPAAIVSLGTMLAALAASIILFIRRRKKNDSGVLSVQGEKA